MRVTAAGAAAASTVSVAVGPVSMPAAVDRPDRRRCRPQRTPAGRHQSVGIDRPTMAPRSTCRASPRSWETRRRRMPCGRFTRERRQDRGRADDRARANPGQELRRARCGTSRALARLSEDIAGAVRALDAGRRGVLEPPPASELRRRTADRGSPATSVYRKFGGCAGTGSQAPVQFLT